MKKKTLLLLAAFSVATMSEAQFRVKSNGSTSVITPSDTAFISKGSECGIIGMCVDGPYTPPIWGYGVLGKSNISQNNVGVLGEAYGSTPQNARMYGVRGIAGNGEYGSLYQNFGVFGQLKGSRWGAGVYGTSYSDDDNGYQYIDQKYAGFFKGNTRIMGDLFLSGTLYAEAIYTPDGEILPSNNRINILSDGTSVTSRLSNVSIFSYLNVPHQLEKAQNEAGFRKEDFSATDIQYAEKVHYALHADQLEEMFPELIYESANGEKLINYTELIPVLVQAINELSHEVQTLKGENTMMSRELNVTGVAETEATDIITLSQNDPNPWKTKTSIRMNVPERVKEASLFIYDMSGKQLAEHRIGGRGETSFTLTADGLVPGMYIYALVADAKVISTKRLILTK